MGKRPPSRPSMEGPCLAHWCCRFGGVRAQILEITGAGGQNESGGDNRNDSLSRGVPPGTRDCVNSPGRTCDGIRVANLPR